MSPLALVIRHGRRPHGRLALDTLPLRIGSSPENDLRLEDPGVAPRHGEITLGEEGLEYRGFDPPVTLALAAGERFRVGPFTLKVEEDAEGASRRSPLEAVLDLLPRLAEEDVGKGPPRELVETLREVFGAGWGALLRLDPEGPGAEVVLAVGERAGASEDHVSATVLRALRDQDAPVLATDVRADARLDGVESIPAEVASLIATRLVTEDAQHFAIYLESPRETRSFTADEGLLLARLCGQAAEQMARALRTRALEEEADRLAELHRRTRPDAEVELGASAAMAEVREGVAKAGPSGITTHLRGETGTGKEVVARALHAAGSRADRPFVAVNCTAIPKGLAESELFGHEKGAFSGAVERRLGRFELAHGGTLLLDEVGDLDLEVQGKLLRVLEERKVTRLGAAEGKAVDVHVISATHRDLGREVAEGRFREDLYYRLSVFVIQLPPLRDRLEDLEPMADRMLAELEQRWGRGVVGFSPEALEILREHRWPGNVRELRNVVEQAYVRAEGRLIEPDAVRFVPRPRAERSTEDYPDTLDDARALFERQHLLRILREVRGDTAQAAERLGLSRSQVYRKCDGLGIDRKALED